MCLPLQSKCKLLQCPDEYIYTSTLVIYWRTYFNKRYLFSVTIASKLTAVLAPLLIAELTERVKSVEKIKDWLGLSSMRLSYPGFN